MRSLTTHGRRTCLSRGHSGGVLDSAANSSARCRAGQQLGARGRGHDELPWNVLPTLEVGSMGFLAPGATGATAAGTHRGDPLGGPTPKNCVIYQARNK